MAEYRKIRICLNPAQAKFAQERRIFAMMPDFQAETGSGKTDKAISEIRNCKGQRTTYAHMARQPFHG
ncbi:hypothetical protein ABTP80_18400, partial [Acinetobacter baumannii]